MVEYAKEDEGVAALVGEVRPASSFILASELFHGILGVKLFHEAEAASL